MKNFTLFFIEVVGKKVFLLTAICVVIIMSTMYLIMMNQMATGDMLINGTNSNFSLLFGGFGFLILSCFSCAIAYRVLASMKWIERIIVLIYPLTGPGIVVFTLGFIFMGAHYLATFTAIYLLTPS